MKFNIVGQIKVEVFDIEELEDSNYALTEDLFRAFNLLNERDWEWSDTVAIAWVDGELVGVLCGKHGVTAICQVAWDYQGRGVGTALVETTGFYRPKQDGAPDFWKKFQKDA